MTGAGGPMRARATAKIKEIEIYGYKTAKDIEADPIEEMDTTAEFDDYKLLY